MSSTLIRREEWLPFYVIFEVVFFACLRLQNDPTGLLSGFLYFTFSFPFFNYFFFFNILSLFEVSGPVVPQLQGVKSVTWFT